VNFKVVLVNYLSWVFNLKMKFWDFGCLIIFLVYGRISVLLTNFVPSGAVTMNFVKIIILNEEVKRKTQ